MRHIMNIGKRIFNRSKELDLNESELGRLSSVPRQTVNRIISGEIKSPRAEVLEPLAKALNVSIDWLVTGKESRAASLEAIPKSNKDDHNTISIPLVEDKNNHHYNMIIGIDMDLEAIKKIIPCKDYSKLSGSTMPDDSMSKTINSGDPLLIDENFNSIEVDGVYKVKHSEDVYIRRFQKSPNGDLLMIADNENYKDFSINSKDLKVIGKIVGLWNFRRV